MKRRNFLKTVAALAGGTIAASELAITAKASPVKIIENKKSWELLNNTAVSLEDVKTECITYTGDGSIHREIPLDWKPSKVIIKSLDIHDNWYVQTDTELVVSDHNKLGVRYIAYLEK